MVRSKRPRNLHWNGYVRRSREETFARSVFGSDIGYVSDVLCFHHGQVSCLYEYNFYVNDERAKMANIVEAGVRKRKTLSPQCINQIGIYENDSWCEAFKLHYLK